MKKNKHKPKNKTLFNVMQYVLICHFRLLFPNLDFVFSDYIM